MTLDFSDEAVRAFAQARLMHLVFSSMIALLVLSGELIAWEVEDFDGFLDIGNAVWGARALIGFFFLYGLFISTVLIREHRIITRLMKLQPQRTEPVVTRALTTVQVLRSTQGIGIACLGACLFFITANQLDLLVPVAAGTIFALVVTPTRSHWRRVFARAATEYPDITIPAI